MSLLYQKNKLGILYISVDYDKVFEALEENTQKNYGIYIVDSAGSEVYEFHSFTGENVDKALNFADFCGIRDGSGDYCSSAVTGVGATEAAGSHAYIGKTAAFVPKPTNASRNTNFSSSSIPLIFSASSTPPRTKSVVVP